MANSPSLKHLQIDKDSLRTVITLGVAAFIIVFSLLSISTLYGQLKYHNRLASADQVALNRLDSDVTADNRLTAAYKKFIGSSNNIIGGSVNGNTGNNGNNAKIILDALPSTYDFPALAASIQYLIQNTPVTINSISGTDQASTSSGSGAGSASTTSSSTNENIGAATAIPFQFAVQGSYGEINQLFKTFQNSIRPIQFLTISLSGSQNSLSLSASAQTFYQSPVKFSIAKKVVN